MFRDASWLLIYIVVQYIGIHIQKLKTKNEITYVRPKLRRKRKILNRKRKVDHSAHSKLSAPDF